MILKDADDRSADIEALQQLEESAPSKFHRSIQKEIAKRRSGNAGEREAAYLLNRQFKHNNRVAVLHDLRLCHDGDVAQIDHLLIHRVQGAAWVLETKNYSGRLTCDEHGDWTVWRNKRPRPIPSPLSQARRQCDTLRRWLDENGYGIITTIRPVVLISPSSSVDRSKLPADSHVVKADNFAAWWEKQADAIGAFEALGMMRRYMTSGMSEDDLIALGKKLVGAHVPPEYDWRSMLRLPEPATSVETKADEPGSEAPSSGHEQDFPIVISTEHGDVRITRIPDGRIAIRNEKNDALVELVRNACKGKARWNPRFRNWLVAESDLAGILTSLRR